MNLSFFGVVTVLFLIYIIIIVAIVIKTNNSESTKTDKAWIIKFDKKKVKIQDLPPAKIPKGIKFTRVEMLWDGGYEGQNMVIGIIDSGIDKRHRELKGQVVKTVDFISDKYNGSSEHGTHVAGIIASKGVRILGSAPRAKLHDYRVFANDKNSNSNARRQSGSLSIVIKAINSAVANGCDIINLSLGIPVNIGALHDAIIKATRRGVVVIVAAGNEGDGRNNTIEISYPAFYQEAIAVGAVAIKNNQAFPTKFSNFNKRINTWADGYQVISTKSKGGYKAMSGTSMSTPLISGVVACYGSYMKAQNRHVNKETVHRFIKSNNLSLRQIKVMKIKNFE